MSMQKRALVAVITLGCVLTVRVAAQTNLPPGESLPYLGPCTQQWTGIDAPPPPIPTAICASGGVQIVFCEWVQPGCGGPGAAPYETRCQACTAKGAHPIDLASGNVFIMQTDINLPGLGGGLHLTRTWNSTWPATQTGMMPFIFGPNWTATYQERVFIGNDGYLKYGRSDGSFWSFAVGGSSYAVAAPGNAGATASQNSTTSAWTITLKNGEQHTFDLNSGSLTAIIDRNGNTTSIAYDAANRLTTVTDPASRHLYFTYGTGASFYLVASVSSDVGVTWSYAYDSQGRLSQITKPDNTNISFQYDSNSNITAVLDTNGVVLESHTYDSSNRGLTSSRANGVEGVTVQYPPAPPPPGIPISE
jgi:YD repeat-containing protein